MENSKTRILEKILQKDFRLCCLCFKTHEQDLTHLDDEVFLSVDNVDDPQNSQKVADMVSCVLGKEVLVDISMFQALCMECTTQLANCYRFIAEVKDNIQFLHTAVENLNYCLDDEPEEIENYKNVFIAVNHDHSTAKQYYTSLISIKNKKDAIDAFQTITGIKEETTPKKKEKIVQNNNRVKISTSEMVSGENLQCKECFKTFNSVPNLRNHFLRVHADKQFKCPQCPKSYSTESLLKAHRSNSHIVVVCTECGKSFNNIYSLKIHEKGHFMKYICPDCGRVYKNQNTFKKHFDNNICQRESRHSPADAKFTCDHCGKKYTQKISLRVHIQYEHGNKKYIRCEWCDKKFWCQSRLKAHIVKHTKEKKFVCTICSGKFVTKESLLYHTRIHTGEKPYACQYCNSRFLSASRRISHIKSHHMDVSVECDICHSKFKTAHYLAKHKKIHEKQDKNRMQSDKTKIDDIDAQFEQKDFKSYSRKNNSVQNNENQKTYKVALQDPNVFEMQIGENDSKKSFGKIEFLYVDPNNEDIAQETVVDHSTEQIIYKVEGEDQYFIKISENVEV